MRAKATNPALAVGLRDPITKMRPFVKTDENGEVTELIEADVPDNSFWRRRLLAGEIELVADADKMPSTHAVLQQLDAAAPTGTEPVAPLTTRKG